MSETGSPDMLTLRPSRSKDGKEGKTVLKHVFAVNTVPRRLRLVAAGCLLGAFLTSLACLVAKRSGLWKARAIGRSHRDHPRTTASASAGSPAAREPSAGAPLQGGSPWSSSQFEAWFNQMGQDTADPTPLLVHRDRWLSPDDEFSSLLRHIWHAQHPRDCSSARLLILTTHWKQGPGSALHMRGLDLLLGLDYGRVVVDAPDLHWDHASDGREYCPSTGFDCYFLPLSNCTVPDNYRELATKADTHHFNAGAQGATGETQGAQSAQWLWIDNSKLAHANAYTYKNPQPHVGGPLERLIDTSMTGTGAWGAAAAGISGGAGRIVGGEAGGEKRNGHWWMSVFVR